MKIIEIRVEYGKGGAFVDKNWVTENAVEQFKAMWVERIRERGWKKEVNFRVRQNTCIFDENGKGEIYGYTVDGFKDVRVK